MTSHLFVIAFSIVVGFLFSKSKIARLPVFPLVLAVLLPFALVATACTAAWLSAVSAMLPSIVSLVEAIVGFVVGLKGKTIPAATVAFIQSVADDIKAEIANVQTLIADYQNAADNTILGKISAVLSGIASGLGNILSSANITSAATVSKLTQLVGLAIAAVQAVIGLIPLVQSTMEKFSDKAINEEALKHADDQAASLVAHHHKLLTQGYQIIRNTPTGEAVVDAELQKLPEKV